MKSCPVLLAYAAVTGKEAYLFAGRDAFDGDVREYLEENHITLRPYDEFYAYAAGLGQEGDASLLICEKRINYRLKRSLGKA